jgi:hypothetical protein
MIFLPPGSVQKDELIAVSPYTYPEAVLGEITKFIEKNSEVSVYSMANG